MNGIRYILLLFCLILAASLIACYGNEITVGAATEGIQVTGTGSVFGEPDIAILNLGIVAEASTVDEARDTAAYSMEQVLDSMKTNGVIESDIQTNQFNIRPIYDYTTNKRTLRGYEVSNIVSAKIRDIDKSGKIIDDTVTAGSKWIRVNSIRFAIDDQSDLLEQARIAAMKDAKAKAQILAEQGGVTLGKPFSISESSGGSPPIYKADDAVGGGAGFVETSIEPGELEISISIVVIYDIE